MTRIYCLFFAVCALTSTQVHGWTEEEKVAIRNDVIPIVIECAEQVGVANETLKEWKHDKNNIDVAKACIFSCILKKTGLLDENGLFSEKAAIDFGKKYLHSKDDEVTLTEGATSCNAVNKEEVETGDKNCDRAKLIFECIMKQANKFGLLLPE